MRHLASVCLCVFAALLGASVSNAADGAITISETGPSMFPERKFLLTLPDLRRVRPSEIRVLENGERVSKPKLVAAGASSGIRAGFVLVIDASESMLGEPIQNAMAAARAFAEERKPRQQLATIAFNADSQTLLTFTTNQEQIDRALAVSPEIAYYTRTYEALGEAIALSRSAQLSTASIVLLSDGRAVGSSSTADAVIAQARAAGVRIFTVGLRSRFYDPPTLRRLASRTGGHYVEATTPDALSGIFAELGAQLANEYLLTYRSLAGPNEPVRVHVSIDKTSWEGTHHYTSPDLTVGPAVYERPLAFRVWTSPLTMFLVALLCSLLVAAAVLALVRPRNRPLRNRMSEFVTLGRPNRPARAAATMRLRGGGEPRDPSRWWGRFLEELEIAQIRMRPAQIMIGTVLGTIVAMWLAAALVGSPVFALLGLAFPLVPRSLIKRKLKRRRRLFEDQLPDNLQVLASALRAGHSLVGALSVVVDDSPEPSRTEFQRVVADEQLGVPLEDALETVVRRMDNRDLEQVAVVAALQRETGGNTAEVLDRVTDTVRGRAEVRRLVRTLTAQGRLARWIVSLLPVGLLVVITMLNREFIEPLYTEGAGRMMLAVAGTMVVAGSLIIKKIVEIKV